MKISAQVSLPLVRNVSRFLDFFFFFLQELIENKFVGFVVTGVAMTTATAPRKKNRRGSHCHRGHLSLPRRVIIKPCTNLPEPSLHLSPW